MPLDHGVECTVLLGDLVVHELMRHRQVTDDFRGTVPLEVPLRHSVEMRGKLVRRKRPRQQRPDLVANGFELLGLDLHKPGVARQQIARPAVKFLVQSVLETVPERLAGPQRIGNRMQRQQFEMFNRAHLLGKCTDHGGIVQVPLLRCLHHRQVHLDDQAESVGGRIVQFQSLGHLERQFPADFCMSPRIRGFA